VPGLDELISSSDPNNVYQIAQLSPFKRIKGLGYTEKFGSTFEDVTRVPFSIDFIKFDGFGPNLHAYDDRTITDPQSVKTLHARVKKEVSINGVVILPYIIFHTSLYTKHSVILGMMAYYYDFLINLNSDENLGVGFFEYPDGSTSVTGHDVLAPVRFMVLHHFLALSAMKNLPDDLCVELASFFFKDPYVNVLKLKSFLGPFKLYSFSDSKSDHFVTYIDEYPVEYKQDIHFDRLFASVAIPKITAALESIRLEGLPVLAAFCGQFTRCVVDKDLVSTFSKILGLEACIFIQGDPVNIFESSFDSKTDMLGEPAPFQGHLIQRWKDLFSETDRLHFFDKYDVPGTLERECATAFGFTGSSTSLKMPLKYSVKKGKVDFSSGDKVFVKKTTAKRVVIAADPAANGVFTDVDEGKTFQDAINVIIRLTSGRQTRQAYAMPLNSLFSAGIFTYPMSDTLVQSPKYQVGSDTGSVIHDHLYMLSKFAESLSPGSLLYLLTGDYSNYDQSERWLNVLMTCRDVLIKEVSLKFPSSRFWKKADFSFSSSEEGYSAAHLVNYAFGALLNYRLASGATPILFPNEEGLPLEEDRRNIRLAVSSLNIDFSKTPHVTIGSVKYYSRAEIENFLRIKESQYKKFSFLTSGALFTLLCNTVVNEALFAFIMDNIPSASYNPDHQRYVGDDLFGQIMLDNLTEDNYLRVTSLMSTLALANGLDMTKSTLRQGAVEFVKVFSVLGYVLRRPVVLFFSERTGWRTPYDSFSSFSGKAHTCVARGYDPLYIRSCMLSFWILQQSVMPYSVFLDKADAHTLQIPKVTKYVDLDLGLVYAPQSLGGMGLSLYSILTGVGAESSFYSEYQIDSINRAIHTVGGKPFKVDPKLTKGLNEQLKSFMPSAVGFYNTLLQPQAVSDSLRAIDDLTRVGIKPIKTYTLSPVDSVDQLIGELSRTIRPMLENSKQSYANLLKGKRKEFDPKVHRYIQSRYKLADFVSVSFEPLGDRYVNGFKVYSYAMASAHRSLIPLYDKMGITGRRSELLSAISDVEKLIRKDPTLPNVYEVGDVLEQIRQIPDFYDASNALVAMGMQRTTASKILETSRSLTNASLKAAELYSFVTKSDYTSVLDTSSEGLARICNLDRLPLVNIASRSYLEALAFRMSVDRGGVYVRYATSTPDGLVGLVKHIAGRRNIPIEVPMGA
jgi:hypothetical protein